MCTLGATEKRMEERGSKMEIWIPDDEVFLGFKIIKNKYDLESRISQLAVKTAKFLQKQEYDEWLDQQYEKDDGGKNKVDEDGKPIKKSKEDLE